MIARLKGDWEDDYRRWQKRDLSARRYVYVWADGVYLQARMEPQAECILVIIGATPEGKKELLGLAAGMRESAQSWKELLVDLKARGLVLALEIAVGDGALGFWKALDEAFPSTRHQRCWVRKTLNVLEICGEISEGRRLPDERPRRTADVFRFSRRALDAPHVESDRERLCNSETQNRSHERRALAGHGASHGVQAGDGGVEKLAQAARTKAVAQDYQRCKIPRRNRNRVRSKIRRLIHPVTQIRA